MDIESLRDHLLSCEHATEGTPFGPDTLVYKVCGKIYAILSIDADPLRLSLKNTPEKNLELRAEYEGIDGAFHMNKVHWNMLMFEFGLKTALIKDLIAESHQIVYKALPKKTKEQYPLQAHV